MKNKKGITLIALVITIIVLIILAAVTISGIVKRNNVIDNARNAREETARQREEEEKLADGQLISDDGEEYDSLDDFINGNPSSEAPSGDEPTTQEIVEIHNWQRNGDTLTCNCNDCQGIKKSGKTLIIGQKVNYSEINGHLSATISAEKSGYDTNQTITKNSGTEWRVLGIEDSNDNGTNETLLLVATKATATQIYLEGAAGYYNWPTESNRIASELYGEGARCITMEDVNRCINYNPSVVAVLLSEIENWDAIKTNGTYTPDPNELNNEETLGRYEVNTYNYDIRSTDATQEERNALEDISDYWLNSQAVGVSNKNTAYFACARRFAGNYNFLPLFYSSNGTETEYAPLRAVVSVRRSIPSVIEEEAADPAPAEMSK